MEHSSGQLLFAAIADDDTGASDLAGMLAEEGVRTLLVIDLPEEEDFARWIADYQAVILAIGTRSIAPQSAMERARQAVALFQPRRPRMYFLKYCSTFDSTAQGNIGPAMDALLDELNEDFTVAIPALPVNGRTTYLGYHFVHQQLLSDSPLRHHPLNPMTNANLVEFLGLQTKRRVGLLPFTVVESGVESLKREMRKLREEGVAIAIVDCLHDRHLETIAEAVADLRLITGGSGPGMKLPAIWRRRGWLSTPPMRPLQPFADARDSGCLIVAGSCSPATRAQNAWIARQGAPVHRLDARKMATGEIDVEAVVAATCEALASGRHCLLSTSSAPEEAQRTQAWGAERGMSAVAVGEAILRTLSGIVRRVTDSASPAGLIFAGGETSGAMCRRLELGALRVGRNIEPGVPLCFPLGGVRRPVALKSGNFGSEDFYGKALHAITRPTEYFT